MEKKDIEEKMVDPIRKVTYTDNSPINGLQKNDFRHFSVLFAHDNFHLYELRTLL